MGACGHLLMPPSLPSLASDIRLFWTTRGETPYCSALFRRSSRLALVVSVGELFMLASDFFGFMLARLRRCCFGAHVFSGFMLARLRRCFGADVFSFADTRDASAVASSFSSSASPALPCPQACRATAKASTGSAAWSMGFDSQSLRAIAQRPAFSTASDSVWATRWLCAANGRLSEVAAPARARAVGFEAVQPCSRVQATRRHA